jgi:hypothetical protein
LETTGPAASVHSRSHSCQSVIIHEASGVRLVDVPLLPPLVAMAAVAYLTAAPLLHTALSASNVRE